MVLIGCVSATAQHSSLVQITGMVRDSVSRDPIPYVSVSVPGTDFGVMTTEHGGFNINTRETVKSLRVSAVGYQTKVIPIRQGQTVAVIDLSPSSVSLGEVVVKKGKVKYSKKNNPAVELARKLIDRRSLNDPRRNPFYSYDKYERMMFGVNDVGNEDDKKSLLKKHPSLAQYVDTSMLTGKCVLPLSVKEKTSRELFRSSPSSHKELVTAIKSDGLDEAFDQASIKRFLDDVFREVDIAGNDVTMLTNRFVSPLSTMGISFYKYFLNDTIDIDGEKCIELSFVPFTPESFGFLGCIYVPLNDSTLFIKRVKLNVPHRINLNYVERVHIIQDFVKAPDGSRLKTHDNLEVEFRILKGTPGLFAKRDTYYSNHSFDTPDDAEIFANANEQIILPSADDKPEEYWIAARPADYGNSRSKVTKMLVNFRKSKLFFWGEKAVTALINGYIPTSTGVSKWDFGPLNTTISGNSLEGVRLRLGGMSTVGLSRHWFTRAYVAYGTRDERLKYMGRLEYSFNEKKNLDQEFPIHSIALTHKYDVDKLGQNYLYTNADNVFLALRRQKDDKMLYLRTTELKYTLETPQHFMASLAFVHNIHETSPFLSFDRADGTSCRRYYQAGFKATLRYAPHETFYQTRSYRIPINMDAPILTLTQTYMPKGFCGSDFEVNITEAAVQKRFWFSAFGYTDIILKGAKIWSRVAYPDLLIPNANLSYTIQPESFALMNAMEFMNDQYLSWDMTYWGNGVLLNRLPLIKKLKWREVFSFRGLWGSLSDKNDPLKQNDLFVFPSNALCMPMGKKPYMEIGAGLDNILTVLRVDYVWRLNYRDTPGINRSGIRIQMHFTF